MVVLAVLGGAVLANILKRRAGKTAANQDAQQSDEQPDAAPEGQALIDGRIDAGSMMR